MNCNLKMIAILKIMINYYLISNSLNKLVIVDQKKIIKEFKEVITERFNSHGSATFLKFKVFFYFHQI